MAAARVRRSLLRAVPNTPGCVQATVAGIAETAGTRVTGELATASGVADGLTTLARSRNAMDAQLGRHVVVAQTHDLMPATVRTALQQQGWSPADTAALVAAAPFADRHPGVQQLWSEGRVSTAVVAALARGLRPMTVAEETETDTLRYLLPQLEGLSLPAVKQFAANAVDLLD